MKSWRYELKVGTQLREAIHSGDAEATLVYLQFAYQELADAGLIDADDCDDWVNELDGIDSDDEDEVNYELDEFYDLCDNIGVWIPISEYESADFDLG